MKASEFDRKFDAGESIVDMLDVARARRPGEETKHHYQDSVRAAHLRSMGISSGRC